MEAGRELDQLIAEKVMGQYPTYDDGVWLYYFEEDKRTEVPHYSTDIKAAWEVVEKMKSEGRFIKIHNCEDKAKWFVSVTSRDSMDEWYALEDSAPHAICLAALKAIGEK